MVLFLSVDEVWDNTSDEAKDLVTRLLCHVKDRWTARDALNHPWIIKHTKTENYKIDKDMLKRLSTIAKVNKM